MPLYRAYIAGLHDRSIGVVQMDCVDDNAAIKSATRLVDNHNAELWQMDRPVARFDAWSKQIFNKLGGRRTHQQDDATPVAWEVNVGSDSE